MSWRRSFSMLHGAIRGGRPWRMFAIGFTVTLVAGCASAPLPDLRVALPQAWRNGPALQLSARDNGSWWRVFGDAQLDALVDQALGSGLDVRQAQARLHAARTLYQHTDDAFRPNLRAHTSDPIDPDASATFFVAGFDAIWELDLFGRGEATRRIARGSVASSQADLRDARVSLAGEVVRNWIELRASQRREALLLRIRSARRQQSQLVARRLELRLAAPRQLALARAAAADADGALSLPRQQSIAAAQALAALLGRAEPDPSWSRADVVPQLRKWRMTATPADALRMRPDVARSGADVLRAAGELGIAHADRYPSIGIGGSIQWSSSVNAYRATSGDEAISALGPIIDIPLFDWGLRKAREEAKSDALLASSLAYRKIVLGAVAEVETALGAVEQQRVREADGRLAWRALGDAAAATAARQALGLDSRIDLLDVSIARDNAELGLTEAQAAHALAYVALEKALGGGPAAVGGETAAELLP